MRDSFKVRPKDHTKSPFVASNIGLPSRQLWYKVKAEQAGAKRDPTSIRFIIGHFVEELILFLAKEAGHDVTDEQARIAVNGVRGKVDARFDGAITDVKTASAVSYRKFKEGEFLWPGSDTDPYGYKYQLGLYMEAGGDLKGYFLVINKESGDMSLLEMDKRDLPDVAEKIEREKLNLDRQQPPEAKCYPDEPMGKSGNMVLHKLCNYCEFKHECWKDTNAGKGLIEHNYAKTRVYFTKLVRDPRKTYEPPSDAEDA